MKFILENQPDEKEDRIEFKLAKIGDCLFLEARNPQTTYSGTYGKTDWAHVLWIDEITGVMTLCDGAGVVGLSTLKEKYEPGFIKVE